MGIPAPSDCANCRTIAPGHIMWLNKAGRCRDCDLTCAPPWEVGTMPDKKPESLTEREWCACWKMVAGICAYAFAWGAFYWLVAVVTRGRI